MTDMASSQNIIIEMVFSSDESDGSNSEVSDNNKSDNDGGDDDDDDDDDDGDDESDNSDEDDRQAGRYYDVGRGKHGNYQEERGDEKTLQSHDQGEGVCGVLGEDELLGRGLDDEKLLSNEKNPKLSTEDGFLEITERTELVHLEDR